MDAAHQLVHDAEPAVHRDRAGVAVEVTGDEAQQRRLADPVGAHEGGALAVADPERHVVEEHVAAGSCPGHTAELYRAHVVTVRPGPAPTPGISGTRQRAGG